MPAKVQNNFNTNKKNYKIMSKKVVCAITIGDLETKTCDTYWLRESECKEFTELLQEKITEKIGNIL